MIEGQRGRRLPNVALALALVVMLFQVFQPATPVAAAEVTIHATLFDASDEFSPSPNVVFISDQVGYAFFVDDVADNVAYKKTADGGASWGSAVALSGDMGTDKNWANLAVWYDQWTPGDSGTKIHIAAAEVATDDIWYNWLDTNGDTMRLDSIEVFLQTTYTVASDGGPSITKSTDGYLFVIGFGDGTGYIYKSTNSGDNWTDTAITTDEIDDADNAVLLPLSGGDVLLIRFDWTADYVYSKVYDEATDGWDTGWTTIAYWVHIGACLTPYGATLNKSTGDIYLAGNTKADDTTGILKAYKYSAGSWSTVGTIVSAGTEIFQVTLAIDENTGDLYAAYTKKVASNQMSVHYKKSIDGGATWGTESPQINTSNLKYKYIRTNFMSSERIYTVWYDDGNNYLLGDTIADITPPVGQTWYLSGGGGYVMYKGDTSKTAGTVTVTDDGSEIWLADEAATIDVGFPANTWTGHITFDVGSLDTTVRVYVGKWDGSVFTPSAADEYADVSGSSDFSFSASSFTVPETKWLAFKIEDYTDGDSASAVVSVRRFISQF